MIRAAPVLSKRSRKALGSSAAKARSNDSSTRTSKPAAAHSSRLRERVVMRGGAYSGASSFAGCGSKGSAAAGPPDSCAAARAASNNPRCPRWTPSKFPMARAPRVSLPTQEARPPWMRIRPPDMGQRPRGVNVRRFASLAAAAFAAAGPASAAEVRVDGSYRMRLDLNSNYLLDPSTRIGQTVYAEHRLRLTPKIVEEGQIEIQGSFDILSGLFAGDLAPSFQELGYTERSQRNGTRAQGFDFRHLFAKLRMPVGIFEIGQMPSDWGMGVLTSGGNQEEGRDFGDIRFGDIVDRVLFATRPLRFLGPRSHLARTVAVAIAGDLIYRDRYAQLVTSSGTGGLTWGDTAWRVLAALVYDPSPDSRAGLYITRRIQSYAANGGDLHVWTFDFHARTLFPLGSFGGIVSLEAEGVEVWGGTSHGANLNSFASAKVAQQGAAAR